MIINVETDSSLPNYITVGTYFILELLLFMMIRRALRLIFKCKKLHRAGEYTGSIQKIIELCSSRIFSIQIHFGNKKYRMEPSLASKGG